MTREEIIEELEKIEDDFTTKHAYSLIDYNETCNPYHEGKADAYDIAWQLVRDLITKAKGKP